MERGRRRAAADQRTGAGELASSLLWSRSVWRRRRGSLLLLFALITLTGTIAVAAIAGARRADTAISRFITSTGTPDLMATFDFEDRGLDIPKADGSADVFHQASSLPGVTSATEYAVWTVTPGPELEPWQIGLVDKVGHGGGSHLVAGHLPDPTAADQVALNESAARALGASVGDRLTLHSMARSQMDEWMANFGYVEELKGPEVPVTVTGIVRSIEDITSVEDRAVTVTPAFFRAHQDEIVNCVCFAAFTIDHDHLAAVRSGLTRLYSPYGFTVSDEERVAIPKQASDGVGIEVTALRLLALAAGLAGLLVVSQAIVRQLSEAGVDDEARRAIGTTRAQFVRSSLLVLAPVLVGAAVAATAFAYLSSGLFPRGLARQVEVHPGLRADLPVLAIGAVAIVLLGVAMTVAAAAWLGRPRDENEHRATAIPLALPPAMMLGAAFTLRPGRRVRAGAWTALLATLLASAGAVGLATFESSRSQLLHDPRLFGLDADLVNSGDVPAIIEARAHAAAAMPGVAAVAIQRVLSASVTAGGPAGELPVEPEALASISGAIRPTVIAGRLPESAHEVAIGRAVSAATGAGVGDSVTIASPNGPQRWTVVGEVVAWGSNEVDRGFNVTDDGLTALAGACAADDCETMSQSIALSLSPGTDGRRTAATLRRDGWVGVPAPSVVDNLRQAGPVPALLGGFLVLLGAAGLVHSTWLLLARRQKDLAIARSIGLDAHGVRSSVRWNASMLVGAGLVVGVPLGLVAGRLAWLRIADRLGVVADTTVQWWVPVAVVAALVALGLAVAEPLARLATRRRPAEVLRAE